MDSKYVGYRARLSVDIPQELQQKLREVIPWGTLGRIVNIMLWDLVEAIEKNPNVLGALLSRYMKGTDVIKLGVRKDETSRTK